MRVLGSILGGEVALGHRENLRWNKFSSFILTACSSSVREEAQTEDRREGRIRKHRKKEKIRTKCFFQDFSMYPFINLILGFTNKLRDASLFF